MKTLPKLDKVKGTHPGSVLKWALERDRMRSSELADSIGEHRQTISAILKEKRNINPSISIKLSSYFDVPSDYFMMLQASYDVKQLLIENKVRSLDPTKFRKVVFWDTNMEELDWDKNSKFIIQRVMERGNKQEIQEIVSHYGKSRIEREIKAFGGSRLQRFERKLAEIDFT